jgi:hypothetical protein
MEKEHSALDTIVNLCILAEDYHNVSTINHLKFLYRVAKEDHQSKKSAVKSLATLYNCDLGITISRAAYQISRFYDKIPEKFMPNFMNYKTIFGSSLGALNQMQRSKI